MINKRKVVLVGTGFVGMSMAYSLINQGISINELILIDIQKEKAVGEAMDLSDGLQFTSSSANIIAGDYDDCKDADIVVIAAGLNQKQNETRLELAEANAKIMKEITENVIKSGFCGIFLVVSNPVDIMTKVVQEVSNFPKNKVIGTGTVLDTSRLRHLLGTYFKISSKNVHTYVMGEHGDSSFVAWEHSYIGCKNINEIIKDNNIDISNLERIYEKVRNSAYEIINRKKATYYGIGLGLAKIIKTILDDKNEILTISTYLNGEYEKNDLYIGVPTIVNREGAKEILELNLSKESREKFDNSCNIVKQYMDKVRENVL